MKIVKRTNGVLCILYLNWAEYDTNDNNGLMNAFNSINNNEPFASYVKIQK